MKYRKRPIVIEAYQTDKEIIIHTLEGDMKASVGDYIITGVNGEQYPCKPDIFEKTYELADDQVSKTISRPRECVNAGCVASCCIAFYKDNKALFKDNPKNCPDFKEEDGESE